jgi:amino acid permease
MRNKKGVIKISNYIIIIIVFGMLSTGLINLMSIANQEESGFLSEDADSDSFLNINTTFGGVLNEVAAETETLSGVVQNTSSESTGLFGFVDTLINSAYSTLQTIFGSFSFMGEILDSITGEGGLLGLPEWLKTGLWSMILIILTFGIYSLLFKSET